MHSLAVIARCYLGETNWAVVKLESWDNGILKLQPIIPGVCGWWEVRPVPPQRCWQAGSSGNEQITQKVGADCFDEKGMVLWC